MHGFISQNCDSTEKIYIINIFLLCGPTVGLEHLPKGTKISKGLNRHHYHAFN